ncbi:hypothetical protein [Frigoriglobus tundricola]|uniref:Uncharacterized protein n=1 Tax=Frigoriglobus tundricola TaxID=2774151 RepID=A0A6M5YGZ2_9BACT|nr:hypothetical protein [Frigoriglobus tundricola]QJW93258.1 hypothetical protein FTUN_0763 [Frigoriglobus tundricola]
MQKIRVVGVHHMANAVRLMVNTLHDAEWLAENARLAGFVASVKPPKDGNSATELHYVLIGGKVDDLRTYLTGNSELELPQSW